MAAAIAQYALSSCSLFILYNHALHHCRCSCNGFVKFVITRDPGKQYKFCALQSRAAQPLLQQFGLTQDDALKSITLVEGDHAYRKSEAALRIASRLGWPYAWAPAFMWVPECLRDTVYDAVAKNRYSLFGKSEECMIPTRNVLSRFLDADEMKAASRRHDE